VVCASQLKQKSKQENTHRVQPSAKYALPPVEHKKNNKTFFCIRQVAAPFGLSGSGRESFNHILDPDSDPDHHRNLITSQLG